MRVEGVRRPFTQTRDTLPLDPQQIAEMARLLRVPPHVDDSAFRRSVLRVTPKCFGVIEAGRPVRDLSLEYDGQYPCRECLVESVCARMVWQPNLDEYLKGLATARHTARRPKKKRLKPGRALYRRPGPPSRPPTKGSKVRLIAELVLAGHFTRNDILAKLNKKFPPTHQTQNYHSLRATLSCISRPEHWAFIGIISRDARGHLYFKNAEQVKELLQRG